MTVAAHHLSDEEIGGLRKVGGRPLAQVAGASAAAPPAGAPPHRHTRSLTHSHICSCCHNNDSCISRTHTHTHTHLHLPLLRALQIFHFVDADADGEINLHDLTVALQHAGLELEQAGISSLLAGLDLAHHGAVGGVGVGVAWRGGEGWRQAQATAPAGSRDAALTHTHICMLCARPHLPACPPQVHVEEFIAAALDQRKVLNAKTVNAVFGGQWQAGPDRAARRASSLTLPAASATVPLLLALLLLPLPLPAPSCHPPSHIPALSLPSIFAPHTYTHTHTLSLSSPPPCRAPPRSRAGHGPRRAHHCAGPEGCAGGVPRQHPRRHAGAADAAGGRAGQPGHGVSQVVLGERGVGVGVSHVWQFGTGRGGVGQERGAG